MLLSDRDITAEIDAGRIALEPYDDAMLQPSSIDVRVDRLFRVFRNHTMGFIDVKHHMEDLTELVGPDALRSRLDPTAVVDGRIEHALRFSLGTAIYAGTSEIQRNIIALQACRLPRSTS